MFRKIREESLDRERYEEHAPRKRNSNFVFAIILGVVVFVVCINELFKTHRA